jgi:hypothetical protein
MQVIAFIEKPDVIKKILKHLGLWSVQRRPQPVANAPPVITLPLFDDSPGPSADDLLVDPQCPVAFDF